MRRERDRRLDEIARLFDQARAYAKAGPDRTVDLVLESLVPVVERRLPLITTVTREQDIRDAVAFADRAQRPPDRQRRPEAERSSRRC